MDYALWLFLNGVYEPMDLDINIGKASPHTED